MPSVSQMRGTLLNIVCLTCCSCSSLRKVKNFGRIWSIVAFLPITGHKCSIELARESKWHDQYFEHRHEYPEEYSSTPALFC